MLNVIMLSFTVLSVVMLSVVTPCQIKLVDVSPPVNYGSEKSYEMLNSVQVNYDALEPYSIIHTGYLDKGNEDKFCKKCAGEIFTLVPPGACVIKLITAVIYLDLMVKP
jgi:hypothetical protein